MLLLSHPRVLRGEVWIVGRFCALVGLWMYGDTLLVLKEQPTDVAWFSYWFLTQRGDSFIEWMCVGQGGLQGVWWAEGTEVQSQRSWAGRASVSTWPHCLLRHCRGPGQLMGHHPCSALPHCFKDLQGFGGFTWCYSMLFCYGWAFFVINTCSSYLSMVDFQAGCIEAIWAAALPSWHKVCYRTDVRWWQKALGSFLFLWWLNAKAFNNFTSSWVVGILNYVLQHSLWILNLSHCTFIIDMVLNLQAVFLIFCQQGFCSSPWKIYRSSSLL